MAERSDARKRFDLELSAMLGAHERLIRDLIVNVIGRMPHPLDEIEAYIERMQAIPSFVESLGIHPVEADQLNQMISENVERTLLGARKDLLEALRQAHQRRHRPDPTES
jgi:hypothetical protein